MHIWIPTYFRPILERALPKDRNRIIIRDYTQLDKFNKTLQARVFDSSVHKYTNLAAHMTEHAFEVLCYTQPSDADKNYINFDVSDIDVSKFNLPEKYVVIPPCFTSKTRVFLGSHINKIVEHCKSKGYSTVFLGNSKTETGGPSTIYADIDPEVDLNAGINLIGATSILEASRILKESACVIGLDNGLLHLAAAVSDDTKIVYGFTTVKPEHRLPFRKGIKGYGCYPVVINTQQLQCVGCQSNFNYSYGVSFTNCFYDDYKCLELLSADLYIQQIDKII